MRQQDYRVEKRIYVEIRFRILVSVKNIVSRPKSQQFSVKQIQNFLKENWPTEVGANFLSNSAEG